MFKRLNAYLSSVRARDPAPRSKAEILLYPGVWAVFYHRIAHWLFRCHLYFLARMVNHWSRWLTAIDIHPGEKIGRNLFIDHGFTVIGETVEIGDNVTIYQCVTLGGTNPTTGEGGKRHPSICDQAIIGSGAQILGPVTIGERARIGAAAVVTEDVPAGATMVGIKARSTLVPLDSWLRDFIPYGTLCRQECEPERRSLEQLEEQLAEMRAELAAIRAERGGAGLVDMGEPDTAAPAQGAAGKPLDQQKTGS